MAEGAVDKPPINRRKIIERPRLTRLLDESPARIKMLVAPAGYGKTTLARQWLAVARRSSWVTCVPASSDIAVLLEQIAGAAAFGLSRRSQTVIQLRSMAEPIRQLPLLIDLLIEDLSDWPDDAWLVLDDYHEIMTSAEAEDLIAEVIATTRVKVLIASRRRPSWATARGLFYGEWHELTQSHLAMTSAEIDEVLSNVGGHRESAELVAMANGWPAFIALAASSVRVRPRSGQAKTDLYSFLLNEIFAATDAEAQHALRELSLAARDHGRLLRAIRPAETSARIAAEAVRVGILTASPDCELELHPLLRQFLQQQCIDAGPEMVDAAVERLWEPLRADGQWDDLFDLAVAANRPERLPVLLRESTDKLLSAGRVASLRRWITYAKEQSLDDWIVPFTEAKLAIREGFFGRARMFALGAVDRAEDEEDVAQSWCVAGQAAHMQGDEESALTYYRTASAHATAPALKRVARWGRFVSSIDAESPDAEVALKEIAADQATETSAVADRWNAQLLYEIRVGGIRSLHDARAAAQIVDLVEDSVRRTAFRSVYASALALAAEYRDAHAAAELFLADAQTARVDFALPYAHTVLAVALLGLRRFDASAEATRQALFEGRRLADAHAEANTHAVMARLLLTQGRYEEALQALDGDYRSGVTRGMLGESLGCRAVALACLGDHRYLEAASAARATSSNLEPKTLAVIAAAIFSSMRNTPELDTAAVTAVDTTIESGAWDLFVCGYRAHPEFLIALRDEPDRLECVLRVIDRAGDQQIALTLGLASSDKRGVGTLSPRECEIHALLALGLTNRQIAQRLFISEATAKVHVHHILEKLDVRTRTPAASRYQRRHDDDQATETSG